MGWVDNNYEEFERMKLMCKSHTNISFFKVKNFINLNQDCWRICQTNFRS